MNLNKKVDELNQNIVQSKDHIDDWIDTPTFPPDRGANYAKFVFEYMRLPAWKQMAFAEWMDQFKLFCTYMGKRYRVTGASRLGDVWLAEDHNRENGYDLRVNVSACTEWGDKP